MPLLSYQSINIFSSFSLFAWITSRWYTLNLFLTRMLVIPFCGVCCLSLLRLVLPTFQSHFMSVHLSLFLFPHEKSFFSFLNFKLKEKKEKNFYTIFRKTSTFSIGHFTNENNFHRFTWSFENFSLETCGWATSFPHWNYFSLENDHWKIDGAVNG